MLVRYLVAAAMLLSAPAFAAEPPAPVAPDKDAVAQYWHQKADQNAAEAANLLGIATTLQAQVKALTEENTKMKADAKPEPKAP
jgi:hypothetical protein